ncbi:alpha/beta hydrolase [Burkholderia multivorans]|uniref:alpha/beta fold hydrolase n=1 Tax=Burkholderiaceae TaxID=119060 RepID=UPI002019E246|nr:MULTISPECIES: alpha/beta hydrolase [Burkholderiaceae]MCL4661356.1 alpha/beta hydrolase [Burkholderia multivorans]MCO1352786.1 alpha/beta hydrolase [Burkholderia multivorans]MCO1413367.1 alpha/beta hydrolase [Burkholderia multivorans]MCO1446442.1 alpha/beta hydrolase [Burkholderia multivorans]MDR8398327.1 alpha/beta hydrolase [Paraburkholderia sp. USG1]
MGQWIDFLGAEIRYVATPSYERIRIAEAGKGNPEVLFLMHGLGGHLEAYAKNVIALSKHFHVIAFDFVGHGLSCKPVDIEYNSDTYANQLLELMNAFNVDKAHLSGESLGGWVAGRFAVKYPERVKRLVLNTAGGIPIVTDKGRRDAAEFRELSAKNVGQQPTVDSVRKRMQFLMHESNWGLLDEDLVETRLFFYTQPDFQRAGPLVLALLQRLNDDASGSQMIQLENIAAETLLYWTKFNPIHDVESARAALPRLSRGSLYISTANAAHWPQYEAPAEFNAVVEHYLLTGEAQ